MAQYENEKDASIPLKYFYIKKDKNIPRLFLSKFTFSLSTGYGISRFRHNLKDFGILQEYDSMPKVFLYKQPAEPYENWVSTARASPWGVAPSPFIVQGDTAKLGFRAPGYNIPFKATVHFEYDKYRIGAGYSIDYMHTGTFSPISYTKDISEFKPEVSSTWLKEYFILVGGAVYRYNDYLLVLTGEFGGMKLGKQYDGSTISTGLFLNFGPSVERDFSEYFKVFVRPSIELRNYRVNFPESGSSITHTINTLYLNVGASYRIPELPKCPFKDCKIQIDHAHGNKVYRSRVHPFYKKQNPHYGEDYPNLIKYKGSNKKKLNPY